jgi:hypothetical protein
MLAAATQIRAAPNLTLPRRGLVAVGERRLALALALAMRAGPRGRVVVRRQLTLAAAQIRLRVVRRRALGQGCRALHGRCAAGWPEATPMRAVSELLGAARPPARVLRLAQLLVPLLPPHRLWPLLLLLPLLLPLSLPPCLRRLRRRGPRR